MIYTSYNNNLYADISFIVKVNSDNRNGLLTRLAFTYDGNSSSSREFVRFVKSASIGVSGGSGYVIFGY